MKSIKTVAALFVFATFGLLLPPEVTGQEVKMGRMKNMQGQEVQTPYISNSTFEETVSSPGKVADSSRISKDGRKGAVRGRLKLQDLLTVSSLEDAIRRLGKPDTVDRVEFSDGGWVATLRYEDQTMFEYRKYEDDTIALTELQLWQRGQSLRVGTETLRPGMRIDELSPVVREAIAEAEYPKGSGIDGIAPIRIAKPGSASGGDVDFVQDGKAQITVHVNQDQGVVKMVRFVRLGPW